MEKQLQDLWKDYRQATISDLMIANEALANELMRTRTESKNERERVNEEVESLSKELKEKTENEAALNETLQGHDERVKDLQKKLRDEHYLKTKVEANLERIHSAMDMTKREFDRLQSDQSQHKTALKAETEARKQLEKQLSKAHISLQESHDKQKNTDQILSKLKKEHEACLEQRELLNGTIEVLTKKISQLSSKHQDLHQKQAKEKETSEQLLSQKNELESELQSLEEIKATLTDDFNSLHELLNQERILTAKTQNEKKRLENELIVAQSTVDSTKQLNEQLETERKDLKIAAKNEKEHSRDLEKRLLETKDKLTSAQRKYEKTKTELSDEVNTKLTTLRLELKGKETNHLAEIRKYKLSLENIREELIATSEAVGKLKDEKSDLQRRSKTLKKSLTEAEETNKTLCQDLAEAQEELERTKERLVIQEERAAQISVAHNDRLAELSQDLQQEALACVRLREQKGNLEKNLEIRENELLDMTKKTKAAICERDQQISQLADTVKTLSVNLKASQENSVKEKEKSKKHSLELSKEKDQLMKVVEEQKRELDGQGNELELLKKEISRLTVQLTAKESDLVSVSKTSQELLLEHQDSLQKKDTLITELKKNLEDKGKIVEDLLSAMQTEEASRKFVQKNLEMTNERNRMLETQLVATNASLDRAVSDSYSAMEAYETIKQKADALKSENSSLLRQYDDWAVKVVDEDRAAQPRKAFKGVGNAVLAKQRMENCGAYSDRLINLMQRRNSVKSNPPQISRQGSMLRD